jgi:hypothetical protein
MNINPHAKLTATLRALLKITIGLTALAVLAGFYDYHSYSTLPPDIDASEVILPSDAVTAIVGLVQFILAIITAITFLMWIYRSTWNLRALSGSSMTFTPGWSVGWHFIPIANLWKPYQVMKEIWHASHNGNKTGHALVGWWWALWLISIFVGRLAFKLVMCADDTASYAAAAMTYMISDGLDLVLHVVALVMVTRIGIAYSNNIVEPAGPASGAPPAASPPPLPRPID